jgi:hypothetical protein
MMGPAVLPHRRRFARAMLGTFVLVAHLGVVIAICHWTLSTDPPPPKPPTSSGSTAKPPKPAQRVLMPTATTTPSAKSAFPTAIPVDARRVINGLRFGGVEVLHVQSAMPYWNNVSHDSNTMCRFEVMVSRASPTSPLTVLLVDPDQEPGQEVIDAFEMQRLTGKLVVHTLDTDDDAVRGSTAGLPAHEILIQADDGWYDQVVWRLGCAGMGRLARTYIAQRSAWQGSEPPLWLKPVQLALIGKSPNLSGRWPVDTRRCDRRLRHWYLDIDTAAPHCDGRWSGELDVVEQQLRSGDNAKAEFDGCTGHLTFDVQDGSYDIRVAADRLGAVSGRGTFRSRRDCESEVVVSGSATVKAYPSD